MTLSDGPQPIRGTGTGSSPQCENWDGKSWGSVTTQDLQGVKGQPGPLNPPVNVGADTSWSPVPGRMAVALQCWPGPVQSHSPATCNVPPPCCRFLTRGELRPNSVHSSRFSPSCHQWGRAGGTSHPSKGEHCAEEELPADCSILQSNLGKKREPKGGRSRHTSPRTSQIDTGSKISEGTSAALSSGDSGHKREQWGSASPTFPPVLSSVRCPGRGW